MLVGAAVVVLAVAALFAFGRPAAAKGDASAPDSVTTFGAGTVTVVPDQATVTAGVHTQAATASGALAANSSAMNDVIAALKAAGGTELQTVEVSLSPQTDDHGDVTGYTADDSVSATSTIAAAGKLVDAAVAAGANTVGGPTLSVSDQDAAYRQALAKAVADARAKAEALARAGGFAVGPVASVSEQDDGAPAPTVWRAAAQGSTPVEPGTQDVTAGVSVTFAIR